MSMEVTAPAPNNQIISYPNNPTLREIFAAYLEAKNSKHAYRVCKHPGTLSSALGQLPPEWLDMTINEFKTGSRKRCEDQVAIWREAGLSFGTCRKRYVIMRAAFHHAIDFEMIDRAQEPTFMLPPNSPPRERVLTEEELSRLMDEIERTSTEFHTRTFIYVALTTGQRSGAIADLKWENVDFENRRVNFKDTEAPNERTKKRRVNQPMSPLLYRILWEAKERAQTDWVIEWRGKRAKNTYHSVKKVYERAGIDGVTRHDLRRSSATLVYRSLKNMNAAANHLGDTVAMAEKAYVQKDVDANLEGIEAVSDILLAARKRNAA